MSDQSERPLSGGNINRVVRIAETVRRGCGPQSGAVHKLLIHLERQGGAKAPRFLGLDETGQKSCPFWREVRSRRRASG